MSSFTNLNKAYNRSYRNQTGLHELNKILQKEKWSEKQTKSHPNKFKLTI